MESTDIIEALRARFDNATVEIEFEETEDYFNGHLTWEGFQGVSFIERQRMVYDFLRDTFGEEAKNINMIFTYTPVEREHILAA
ncbi:MAG: hypothetical protein NT023_11370 [Armatimonadetes bacterium]|nr:hypothetical protein [Armatimonadota bacterium]